MKEPLERLPAVLFEVGKLLGSDMDAGQLLSRLSKLLCELVDAEACSVMLLDTERTTLLAKAAYGLRTERMHSLSFRVGEGVAGWVVQHGEPALIADAATDPRFVALPNARTPIVSMACVPISARGEPIGVLTATSGKAGVFLPSHVDLLQFLARTIALDMENVRLQRLAVTDLLTGTYNREFLAQRLPLELTAATEKEHALCLALVDVDHFKKVNDECGHAIGDEVLVEVARRIRSAVRGGDLLIRYGGEEFLVVLPKADREHAREVCERIRVRVAEQPVVAGNHRLVIHVSIGVAQWQRDEASPDLIRRADTALYLAKGKGRDRVELAR